MNKILLAVIGATALLTGVPSAAEDAYPDVVNDPVFRSDGQLEQPRGFRRWVFIGSPLTPNALNEGGAGFPEFHNVYVEPAALDHYRAAGVWPEGTVLVKELQLTAAGRDTDGSRIEASGRGYFPAALNGLDVSVKDTRRFAETNGWGFFNFGHHAPPYAAAAPVAPREACAACHAAAGHEDMVFVNFYQQLRRVPTAAR